jgi:hypothetical protein
MQEVSDFCLGNFADDATLVLISFLPLAKSLVSSSGTGRVVADMTCEENSSRR